MELKEIIENLLRKKEAYISEDDKLLKAKIYEDTQKLNPELIELLLSNEKVKEMFFISVKGVLVFDKEKFISVINSKNFLPDSYTKYCNKIGLTHNNRFISKSNDVVLDFPYKDCILAGGQTKDDQKREEIVFNEIIASDEITRMLAPKVFTNAKRYTKDGIEEDITFNEDDNLIIKGNNLIALSLMLKRYEGKVKCIYIDPPYNTGNDSFGYNDKFNHSTWLVFMKNRLELAKKLLSKDGGILVQIDNSPSNGNSPEFGYLQVLMDEIFERRNYITFFTWKKKGNASNTKDGIGTITESILMYAKDIENLSINLQSFKRKYTYEENGEIFNLEFPVKTNEGAYKRNSMLFPIKTDEGIFYPPEGKRWTIGEEGMNEIVDKKKYKIVDGQFKIKKYPEDYIKGESKLYNNLFLEQGSLKQAKNELKQLNISTSVFDTPKPEILIERLLEIITNENDLVLDFFIGSGTTCAVAHKMGRKYIGIEQMDYINDITIPRLEKVIQGEQGGISKSVNWEGGGSFVYCELKENAYYLIEIIQNATEENINEVKEIIYNDDRIIPYITKKELEEANIEFEENSLEGKKNALINLIDKNKLYVNFSDIDDEEYKVTESERKFTNSFYKGV